VRDVVLLEARGLFKHFMGLCAIRNVSLDLHAGEVLGLIGPNGAGKTTLFNLISGFQSPDEGEILYKGKSIVGLQPYQICHVGIGRTFQIVKPFVNLSTLENVMIGCFHRLDTRTAAERESEEILEFLGLTGKRDQKAGFLTLAEKKKLELAKALATKPEILLLDEVMAGLNPSEVDQIMELVRQISKGGITLLVIEHVMRAVMNISHRIVVLSFGEMIAEGKPEDVSSNRTVIEAYLGEEVVDV
jgi:branched-chain amino acid transport system ATP-binding protein